MSANRENVTHSDSEMWRSKLKKLSRIYPESDDDKIVISGMSGRFPRCRNVREMKENLYSKVDMVDDDERRWHHINPDIPKRSGKLYDLEKFDATFFGVHFKQVQSMDPQARIIMEVAYEAVIDAGINPKSLRGTRTGVYVGMCLSESEKMWFYEKLSSGGFGITGCSRAMMANRISYAFDLNGPSFLVDTTCSSSMHALDTAFTAFRNGEIDAAIIGGTNLSLHPLVTLHYVRMGVLAPDGYCRPFDKDASGYTRSEAITSLFLQRKRDAKRIYAEVIYSKTNYDGYKPEGITHPSGRMQEKLLREFYSEVNIRPSDLGYLEANSTGTIVGDHEECRAIDNVLCSQRKEPLLVGSVKSNIGHTNAASGICSLVKTIFALDTGKISPNINFSAIKEEIPALAKGRLKVVTDVELLQKPYIGVNSFGFGGANAHALLKAWSKKKINEGLPSDDIPRIVGWAGRNEDAVSTVLDSLTKTSLDTEYVALLHNIQREEVTGMVARGFGIYAKNGNEGASCLMKDIQHFSGIKRPLVWVFSGMGSQWTEMGSSLMEIPVFRNSIERCHQELKSKGLNLIDILTSKEKDTYDNILHSFVGIAAIQIGLVDLLRTLNLEPDYIIGHSVGELGCGYADGGFTPEQMITAAYYRGKVSLDIEKIHGSMAAIGLGYKDIIRLVPDSIEVACHNGFDSSTISGPSEDVARFVSDLKSKGIFAKEVPCSNIAYHSRYIAHMGPQLLKYLKETIPNPKQRSSKWLSSSVPRSKWEEVGRDLCSAEYHTNNLLSSVLFEETFAMLPNNALTIEIAPHGLLQGILKRSMPGGVHVALTQRGSKNNSLFFMGALGKLFNNGVTLPFENLYPRVQFPVSRGTPDISSLIKWDHSEDWFVAKFDMKSKSIGELVFQISLKNPAEEYLAGHEIDGKILVSPTFYLQRVWETFSLMHHGPNFEDVPVEFEDVRFLEAMTLSQTNTVKLTVMIHYGTGDFEITEFNRLIVTGNIKELENPTAPVPVPIQNSEFPTLSKKDFYKELKLRGYHYNGAFKAVHAARSDGLYGKIEWAHNWVTFMDAMMQIHIVGTDSRTLFLPTKIRKLCINGRHHLNLISQINPEEKLLEVYVNPRLDRVVAGGIEMMGLQTSAVQRQKPLNISVLEKYQFVPHFPAPQMTPSDAARICVQLGLENVPVLKMKVTEVDTEAVDPIVNYFLDAIEDLPLITGDYILLSKRSLDLPGIHMENGKLSTQTNCYFIIAKNLMQKKEILITAHKSLMEGGFLLSRQTPEETYNIPADYKLYMVIPTTDNEVFLLLQKQKKSQLEPAAIKVSTEDKEFSWVKAVQTAIAKGPVVLYAQNEKINGLIGLVKCMRKEPNGHLVRGVLIDDKNAPLFDLANPFYKNQLSLGLGINVYREGQWGTYRHIQLISEELVLPRADHIYANLINPGDLSSLRWFQGHLNPKECRVKVTYSSLNFHDVSSATGVLPVDLNGSSRMVLSPFLGYEYSGFDTLTGKRIMSMCHSGGLGSFVRDPGQLVWEVPEKWSLEEAATIPVVYSTVYCAFFMEADIRKGKTILIHAGTGGIGLAAIRVALAYGLEVFTTVSTPQKRAFLLETFPQLQDSHIGNSRDTSFETMIQQETDGRGVDFVLNSLSKDQLLASLRCLGEGGHFLEIGKFDLFNDSQLGMKVFLKELSFHAVLIETLLHAPVAYINKLKEMIEVDIAAGIIQPLPTTVFTLNELEQGFRYHIGGKHIGKVLIKIRDDLKSADTLPVPVIRQVYFNSNLSYVIYGGLGGFGLELADWMAVRGARKLVLSSRREITNDYQRYRIALWKNYGCTVLVTTADITTREGCESLLKVANNLGPVGGIFNLAAVLRDAVFFNQTVEKFQESFAPKALATQYLDELSRKLCPDLEHFIVFSSVTCGRGNAGQTNFDMANSVMERIVENRVADGFPGKAIQWGAVGEVSLVGDMAEDKIDLEIGGTLQQRISFWLHELDNLLSTSEPIVAVMIVAKKSDGRGGNGNIMETVMNIMGIRDLKSVSWSTTLPEIGMNSLMAVEIKHTLEHDFKLSLSSYDLRLLTLRKLQEYADAREREGAEVIKLGLGSEDIALGLDVFLRNLGDEANCHKTLLPLVTSVDATKLSSNPSIIITGLEGTASATWYTIGSRLLSKSAVLQLHNHAELTSIKEVTEAIWKKVKSVLKPTEFFYIVGHSFGALIALHLTSLLEKAGYRGNVVLVDGAPHFLKMMTLRHLGENFRDEDLYDILMSKLVSILIPEKTLESAMGIFVPLKNYEEKMTKFVEFAQKQDTYSVDYAQAMVKAMFNRIKMIASYDLNSLDMLKSPIVLVRQSDVYMQEIEEDYCLSKITKGKVTVKFIEGNHATMLENPRLVHIINDFHPATEDDRNFMEYIKDCMPMQTA